MAVLQNETERETIIEMVRELVPRLIDRELPHELTPGVGRCLPASRVGMEALRYFGIAADPYPCLALAANREWLEWRDAGMPGEMPDEAWAVAIDPRDERQRHYNAHMVLGVGPELLDLDARQLARPHKGIFIPETVLALWEEDGGALELAEGGALVYVPHIGGAKRYSTALDWRISATWAGPVIREIKKRLGSRN